MWLVGWLVGVVNEFGWLIVVVWLVVWVEWLVWLVGVVMCLLVVVCFGVVGWLVGLAFFQQVVVKSRHSNYIPMQKEKISNNNGCGEDTDDNNQVAGIYERAQFNADPRSVELRLWFSSYGWLKIKILD